MIISISEIAEARGISRNHLLKVVNGLMDQGMIQTFRRQIGGLQLTRSPHKIKVVEVVRYMEGNISVIDYHEPYCPIIPVCKLMNALSEAHEAFYKSLNQVTLADLIKDKEKKLAQFLTA